MPRSPSPSRGYRRDQPTRPPYRDRPFRPSGSQAGPSRYIESNYDDRRGAYDRNTGRTWGNYQSRGGESGYSGRGREEERSRSRSRTPSVDQIRSRPRSNASQSPSKSRRDASATPEEGQIMSPVLAAKGLPARPADSPSVPRRRSPSPRRERWDDRRYERDEPRFGERGYEGGYKGRYDDGRDNYGYRGRGRGRGRARGGGGGFRGYDDRGGSRDRDTESTYYRDTRRSRSPHPRQQARYSRSPSTTSSYRSSRYTSPDKRKSPIKRDRTPRTSSVSPLPPLRTGPRDPSLERSTVPTPPLASTRPIPVPIPLHGRLPPAGPRSERIPSGPRGYQPTITPVLTPPPPPPQPPEPPYRDREIATPPPPPPPPTSDPPPPAVSPVSSLGAVSGGPRLSWSERKKIPPLTPTFPDARTVQSQAQAQVQAPVQVTSTTTTDTANTGNFGPNPYSSTATQPHRQPSTISSELQPKSESPYHRPYSRGSQRQGIDTPPPPPRQDSPALPQAVQLTEEQIAEKRRKEDEMKVLGELPSLKIGFMGNWEAEVDKHYSALYPLEISTSRSQASFRIAHAHLADVELERLAAVERRKVVDGQLMRGTLGMGVMGV